MQKTKPKATGEKSKKKAQSIWISEESTEWINLNLPRGISTSRFASAAIDHFIKSGAGARFISDENKKK